MKRIYIQKYAWLLVTFSLSDVTCFPFIPRAHWTVAKIQTQKVKKLQTTKNCWLIFVPPLKIGFKLVFLSLFDFIWFLSIYSWVSIPSTWNSRLQIKMYGRVLNRNFLFLRHELNIENFHFQHWFLASSSNLICGSMVRFISCGTTTKELFTDWRYPCLGFVYLEMLRFNSDTIKAYFTILTMLIYLTDKIRWY